MGFYEYNSEFGGLPVQAFDGENCPALLEGSAWRITIDWDDYENGIKFVDRFAKLLACGDADKVESLVVGCWEGGAEGQDNASVIEAIVSARDDLPNLQHLFIGDILLEECEVSWIVQSDLSPLFLAFPKLKTLKIRGTSGLSLGRPVHDQLETLIIEGGGMPGSVVRELTSAELPKLRHLEIWLGNDGYGRDVDIADLSPILSGKAFPKLTYLGLRNDSESDQTVDCLADASILDTLESLDLSLGTLTDTGVEKLAENERLKTLKSLDIHHHFANPDAIKKLSDALPNTTIDSSSPQREERYGDEVYRYNFVSE